MPSDGGSSKVRRALWLGVCTLILVLGLVGPAQARRALLDKKAVGVDSVPDGIEGACGIAFGSGNIYVSDYYHHSVDVFNEGSRGFMYRMPVDPLDGACGLATSAAGVLYANNWHQGVERLLPSPLNFDSPETTGVAVDQATGRVYVDARTHIAVYEPTGGPPILKIGLGTIGDGYGVAVGAGQVFVPDAASRTVKVYEPATNLTNPVKEIEGPADAGLFNSLVDAAVAFDPTAGHVLVLDNRQPGFEHPEAVIDEFDPTKPADENYLGQAAHTVIDGEPSGLALDGVGSLWVTSGNDEEATVFRFGPYVASSPESAQTFAGGGSGTVESATAIRPEVAAISRNENETDPVDGVKLRLLPVKGQTAGAAAIRAAVSAPGTISVAGRGLKPARVHLDGPGVVTLRLRLNGLGRRELARSTRRRLEIAILVTFAPERGDPVQARQTVGLRRPR